MVGKPSPRVPAVALVTAQLPYADDEEVVDEAVWKQTLALLRAHAAQHGCLPLLVVVAAEAAAHGQAASPSPDGGRASACSADSDAAPLLCIMEGLLGLGYVSAAWTLADVGGCAGVPQQHRRRLVVVAGGANTVDPGDLLFGQGALRGAAASGAGVGGSSSEGAEVVGEEGVAVALAVPAGPGAGQGEAVCVIDPSAAAKASPWAGGEPPALVVLTEQTCGVVGPEAAEILQALPAGWTAAAADADSAEDPDAARLRMLRE